MGYEPRAIGHYLCLYCDYGGVWGNPKYNANIISYMQKKTVFNVISWMPFCFNVTVREARLISYDNRKAGEAMG